MEEVWKDINGYEGIYQVSNLGRIKSLKRYSHGIRKCKIKELILRPADNGRGYLFVVLRKECKPKNVTVHRLVALNFIPLIDGKNEINHIDGNKQNNSIFNLEWSNRSENNLHRYRRLGYKSKHRIKCAKYNDIGEIIEVYDSLIECGFKNNIHPSGVYLSNKNNIKINGYYYKYI